MTDIAKNPEKALVKKLAKKMKRPLCMNCRWQGVKIKNAFGMVCMADKNCPSVSPDHTCEKWTEKIYFD